MATFKYVLALVATLALAFVSLPGYADFYTLLKLQDEKAPRGMDSIPNHPRACGMEDKLCFHNVVAETTFGETAKSLAQVFPGVTAEDIIHYSGWEPYVNDRVLLMDKMYYAYSIGPKGAEIIAQN
jgi:hypothetical protein